MTATLTKTTVDSAATLVGFPVRSSENEDIACIEELMIDPESGRVAYAVLSLGGFLGFGGKLYAVPWSALELDPDRRVFVLETDKELLAHAPAFHEENWPDFGDQDWGSEVHAFYGRRPYWEAAA